MLKTDDLIGIAHKDMDCWRLVEEMYKRNDQTVPSFDEIGSDETSKISLQFMNGTSEAEAGVGPWAKLDEPEAPCLVVIKNHIIYTAHCGVYIGNGMFIHSLSDAGVIISRISEARWKRKIKGYYRLR